MALEHYNEKATVQRLHRSVPILYLTLCYHYQIPSSSGVACGMIVWQIAKD